MLFVTANVLAIAVGLGTCWFAAYWFVHWPLNIFALPVLLFGLLMIVNGGIRVLTGVLALIGTIGDGT